MLLKALNAGFIVCLRVIASNFVEVKTINSSLVVEGLLSLNNGVGWAVLTITAFIAHLFAQYIMYTGFPDYNPFRVYECSPSDKDEAEKLKGKKVVRFAEDLPTRSNQYTTASTSSQSSSAAPLTTSNQNTTASTSSQSSSAAPTDNKAEDFGPEFAQGKAGPKPEIRTFSNGKFNFLNGSNKDLLFTFVDSYDDMGDPPQGKDRKEFFRENTTPLLKAIGKEMNKRGVEIEVED